jgi:hypothetical protein
MAGTAADPCRRIYIRRVEAKNLTRTPPTGSSPSWAFYLANIAVGAVEGCYLHHTQHQGIRIVGCTDLTVSGNVIEDCGEDHIAVISGSRILIVDNVVDANTTTKGACIAVNAGATIVGNVCYAGARGCVEIRDGASDVLVAGNALLEAGNTLGTARPESVLFNVAKGSGVSMLLMSGNSTGITRVDVADNLIFAPRNHGVVISTNDSAHSITDVSVSGNLIWLGDPPTVNQPDSSLAGCGVIVEGSSDSSPPAGPVTDVRINDNDIRKAKGSGIFVKGSNNNRWDVRANTVIDSGTSTTNQPGIVIDGFGGFTVNDNRSQDSRSSGKTQSYGLKLANTSGLNRVTNNDLSGNGSGAINQSSVNASTHVLQNLGDDLT